MLTFIIFLLILSLLIFIHELGHFLSAKRFGIKVEEFGFGYPPRAWGKKIGETIYSLNWLPFGGFVRIFGEDYSETTDNQRALFNKPKRVRAMVAIAGVVGNFLLGIVCFSIVYSLSGIPTQVPYVRIEGIAPNSPAQKAGIQPGEVIVSFNGQPIKSTDEFVNLIKQNSGKEIILVTQAAKSAKTQEYRLLVRPNPPQGEGPLGVAVSQIDMVFYPFWQMPFRGIWVGLQEAIGWGVTIAVGIYTALRSLFVGVVPEVAGPVGIYQITSGVVKEGWMLTLQFIGVLSINLGVLNLLPIPALDGGRLLFIAIEAITGRRVKPQIEQYIHMAGMVLLVSLMLLVTFNDFSRLFSQNPFFTSIWSNINSIIEKVGLR
jgi:regulator of sigma E protease